MAKYFLPHPEKMNFQLTSTITVLWTNAESAKEKISTSLGFIFGSTTEGTRRMMPYHHPPSPYKRLPPLYPLINCAWPNKNQIALLFIENRAGIFKKIDPVYHSRSKYSTEVILKKFLTHNPCSLSHQVIRKICLKVYSPPRPILSIAFCLKTPVWNTPISLSER